MSIVLSSQPNYKVLLYKHDSDNNPFTAYVNENSSTDALNAVLAALADHDNTDYVKEDFGTVDGEPSYPEEYIETPYGWVKSDLVCITKVEMDNVSTIMTPVDVIPYLNGSIKPSEMNETIYKKFLSFCDELADAHVNPHSCEPMIYKSHYFETEETDIYGLTALCKYLNFAN